MRSAFPRIMLFAVGLLLIGWALLPGQAGHAGAAPPLLVTETPTSEPPTRTATLAPTPPDAPSITPTDVPTATPTLPPPTDEPLPDPEDIERTPTPTITLIADPAVTKSVDKSQVQVGDSIQFTITVTNLGNTTASDVVVDDSLPPFLSLEGVTATRGEINTSGSNVRVTIGDLAPGEVVTISISARVTAQVVPPANINTAIVASSSTTDNPSNNQSSVELFSLESATPTPTPEAPVALPVTGNNPNSLPLLVAALGLSLIMISLFARIRSPR